MDQPATQTDGQPARDTRRFRWAMGKFALATLALFLAPGLMPIAALAAVLVTTLAVPVSYFFRREQVPRQLRRAGACVGFLVLAIALIAANKRLAESRMTVMVNAMHAYHDAHGAYPADLADLTPDYIARVPRANLWLFLNGFRWDGKRFLGCDPLPPFGWTGYDFERETRVTRG